MKKLLKLCSVCDLEIRIGPFLLPEGTVEIIIHDLTTDNWAAIKISIIELNCMAVDVESLIAQKIIGFMGLEKRINDCGLLNLFSELKPYTGNI